MAVERWSAIQSALVKAAHAGTGAEEAITSLRFANKLLENQNLALTDLQVVKDSEPEKRTPLAMLRRIEELESNVNAYARNEKHMQATLAARDATITDLQATLQAAQMPTPRSTLQSEKAARRISELEAVLNGHQAREQVAQKRIIDLEGQIRAKPAHTDLFDAELDRLRQTLRAEIDRYDQLKAVHNARQKDLEKALDELDRARASAQKAQLAPDAHVQRYYAVLRKTLEILREIVSDRTFDISKQQGETYVGEEGIVGGLGWLRRSPGKRNGGEHSARAAKPL